MFYTTLLCQKLFPRDSSLAGLARVVGVDDVALHDFVERIEAALDAQLAKLVRVAGMIVPTLRAWIISVDEGRAADAERFAHFIQIIRRRIGGAGGGDVAAGWVGA